MEQDAFASTPLFLTDGVTININVLTVQNVMVFFETVKHNMSYESVLTPLYLHQDLKVNQTLKLSASESLIFTQDAEKNVRYVTASNHLAMWCEADYLPKFPLVSQGLNLVDDADYITAKAGIDTLIMTTHITYTKAIAVEASSTLTMKNLSACYLPTQWWTSYDVVVVNP